MVPHYLLGPRYISISYLFIVVFMYSYCSFVPRLLVSQGNSVIHLSQKYSTCPYKPITDAVQYETDCSLIVLSRSTTK
jgi:hypothetical protein